MVHPRRPAAWVSVLTVAVASLSCGSCRPEQQDQTDSFKAYIDDSITAKLKSEGVADPQPNYSVVVSDDLNGDGVRDYVIYNESNCGSGGCPYEIYIGDSHGGWSNLPAPGLVGVSSVFVRPSNSNWKEVFTSDDGGMHSYPIYSRNIYDPQTHDYIEVESRFCGGADFDACTAPVIFCDIDARDIDVDDTAKLYRSPYDEAGAAAALDGQDAARPLRLPNEAHWIKGESLDGKWFLLKYRFSGLVYAKRTDMTGLLPDPREACDYS